uniref:Uncharacterized protein n=1 Tax=Oryza punctata TaxID=4537 RepID=A0A0E0LVM3_ORYPU
MANCDHPGRRTLRPFPPPGQRRPGALLPRGHPVPMRRQRRRRRRHRQESGGDDAAAQVRAGPGVRGGGRVRGIPLAREPGGGRGPPQRELGRAAPVAQPLHLLTRHRRLRPCRPQRHARRRRRRAHAHLPHAQVEVGPGDVGCAAGGRDLLPGGAAPILPALPGWWPAGGRAGGAEQRNH